MSSRRPSPDGDPVRITTAATNRQEEISHRQRRYVISMTIRTVCFLAAVAVGPGWLRWVLIAGAVLLPYVAVVLANGTDNRSDAFALRGAPAGHELPGRSPGSLPGGPE
ncbi:MULTISPECIES: DUF3099 domain-containing protein [Nocardioides]|uniref:DUF3099 domain-containing protein n=1 Tax=Nocardioides TaxID=1839 RepID=UPI000C790C33|nr:MULTISPECIES: DUF3099 domain-containing protein [Nocardioides]